MFSVDDGFCGRRPDPGDVRAQGVETLDEAEVAVALEAQTGRQGEVPTPAFAGDDDPGGVDPQLGVVERRPT